MKIDLGQGAPVWLSPRQDCGLITMQGSSRLLLSGRGTTGLRRRQSQDDGYPVGRAEYDDFGQGAVTTVRSQSGVRAKKCQRIARSQSPTTTH
jgi:hypothetical protein